MTSAQSWIATAMFILATATPGVAATLSGEIRDVDTSELLPARLYIQSADGKWFFARSADKAGSAVTYQKARGEKSVENHTALSAHPFEADLPPGTYTLTVERGKEYLPAEETIEVADKPLKVEIELKRWIDMAARGWYSGDTHVHRTLADLPTAMLADDVNVALPLTSWVTKSDTPPGQSDRNQPAEAKLIEVTPKHVIWPLNTEYEIFTVKEKQHTLGAVFALNQKEPLTRGVPLVQPIAEEVHRQGGLLDLDKHNWPWSMMLVPVMKVDLFELANNHHWRTEFAFRGWGEPIPRYMGLPTDPQAMDERAWTDFGFQNYYALLNCGFRLMPSAGTASGVHPVPLGWSRVYVHCPEGFSYDAWMDGLKEGRSFVTTGPLMTVRINDSPLGKQFQHSAELEFLDYKIDYEIWNTAHPVRIEVLQEGNVIGGSSSGIPGRPKRPRPAELPDFPVHRGISRARVSHSTWLAIRCFETMPDGRERFAHSAPVFIDLPGKPLRPQKAEVEYLISRVKNEIERNTGVLSNEALAEYLEALAAYEVIAKNAK